MIVISTPWKLRLAAMALYWSIPLVAFQVAIAHRVPWWNLPYRNMAYWSLAFLLICIPLSVWILSAKKWVLFLIAKLFSIWVIASAYEALRLKYPPLGFYAIFVSAFCMVEFLWLRREMSRSFIDPGLAWYQSLPKPIPGLTCELLSEGVKTELKVSRIDAFGAFLFTSVDRSRVQFEEGGSTGKLTLRFIFRNSEVICQGSPVLNVGEGRGVGVEFHGVSWDLRKEIGDFVELLRGEGYA